MADEVTLYGTSVSLFSRRVELALKLKGVPFEYIEEDLSNKSPQLLESNPVNKQVPVLVHNGKPIAESLVILEYIDETWKDNPILPQDPYQRAMARFWAKFLDEKVLITGWYAHFSDEKEREVVIEELSQQIKFLENELNGKDFFGGETIGFVDIVAANVIYWFQLRQEALGVEALSLENFSVLYKWIRKLQEIDVVNECQPPKEKHFAFFRALAESAKSTPK